MYQFPIGVVLDCFPGSLKERLSLAEKLGLNGVQVYGIEGEISPEMTVSARADFKRAGGSGAYSVSGLRRLGPRIFRSGAQ